MKEINFNFIFSGILQVIVFSVIPLVWWGFTERKKVNFFEWIGLKKIEFEKNSKAEIFKIVLLTMVLSMFVGLYVIPHFVSVNEMATSTFKGKGISVLFNAIYYSFIITALSEEIFFRGFVCKRFLDKFGLITGNVIQSLVFGLLHGIMFAQKTSILGIIIIVVFTSILAYLMCYINEKIFKGSIFPSILLHGITNLFASILSMFNII